MNKRFKKMRPAGLKAKADQIRREVVEVAVRNGAGHIAPSLSSVDLLTALYYRALDLAADPEWPERDRLVFSKAHGAYGLYAILADLGYIKKRDWQNFYQGSFLSGCVERSARHGLEAGCGSLGHGLPQAVGIAFGAKLQGKRFRTYCIVGDGEMQEGANWEGVQFAVKHQLANLTIIVDHNRLQAMDFTDNILTPKGKTHDLKDKFKAFGCLVKAGNGHDPEGVVRQLEAWGKARSLKQPQVLIARTIKGYGLRCMENVPKFHFRVPTRQELAMGKRYG